jgi:hypothetical protein
MKTKSMFFLSTFLLAFGIQLPGLSETSIQIIRDINSRRFPLTFTHNSCSDLRILDKKGLVVTWTERNGTVFRAYLSDLIKNPSKIGNNRGFLAPDNYSFGQQNCPNGLPIDDNLNY